MRFVVEISAPDGEDFPTTILDDANALQDIGLTFNDRRGVLLGHPLHGEVIGAAVSPRDRTLRITVKCAS